ncbi:nitroreductase family protein (plasmid) [Novosphingobium sp. BL-8A]|uniref:nitroreductase family protein n=1 Tax=Novosphingobium sp. BL-8A TaxID=3127639 RepID=UPI0037569AF8
MSWERSGTDYWRQSSELIFQHHKLEKGLCLPRTSRRFFGQVAAENTVSLMKEWRQCGLDVTAPVYRAAEGVLRSYRAAIIAMPGRETVQKRLLNEIDGLVSDEIDIAYRTPLIPPKVPDGAYATLLALSQSRRSTRDFASRPVDLTLLERAATVAQLSPSACNRQPWHLHLYDDPEAIKAMLALQNGNSGFGHTVPLLAVITSDMASFFDSSERMQPVLDGGLFLMTLLLALEAQGLATCCLNWCVDPATDKKGHRIGAIPEQEKILTFLAIGYREEGATSPLSARRPIEDVIRHH